METYAEMKARHQRAVNELPVYFAFSEEQLIKALDEMGASKDDKAVPIGNGGYCLMRNVPIIRETFERHDREVFDAMHDPDFAYDAILCEMKNHEYIINWQGDWDVCQCFGRCEYGDEKGGLTYLRELGYPDETLRAYERASRDYYRLYDEDD